jgi:hypothetical protein
MSLEDADAARHLGAIPDTERGRELWFQNAAGYILNRDAGLYAVRQLDPDLSPDARAAALKAINDTLYGMCMIADGVTGGISTPEGHTSLSIQVDHQPEEASSTMPFRLDLFDGDGACMGYHAWIEGNFRLGLD